MKKGEWMKSFKSIFFNMMMDEMIVKGEIKSGNYVLVVERYIFVFDLDINNQELFSDILVEISKVHPSFKEKNKLQLDGATLEDLIKLIRLYVPDAFIGFIKEGKLVVDSKYHRDPKCSNLIYKVTSQLKLKYEYPVDHSIWAVHDTSKSIPPSIAYHGTSYRQLDSILKYGLLPSDCSSWGIEIKNNKKLLFISTQLLQPIFHALRRSAIDNSLPVIIEFNIPSSDYLVQDYDIENYVGKSELYNLIDSERTTLSTKSFSLSKEFGLYGYIKAIKPSFITHVFIPNKYVLTNNKGVDYKYLFGKLDNYNRLTLEKAKEYMDIMNHNFNI